MSLLFPAVFFAFGAIVASFVGVLAGRLNTGQSFLVGRSRCDACGMTLTSLMLVPIVSYVAYGGRAHCCGARLSPLSPATELLLGALFTLSYFQLGFSTALPFMFLSLAILMALVLYDLWHQILPTPLLIAFVLVSALTGFLLASSPGEFYMSIFVALLIGGSLALIHFLSRGRAMGFADAPFAFGLSLLAGPAAFSGFIFSFWIGAVIGIVILLKRPRGSRMGGEVPFAPFLAAGFLLAYFTQWNLLVYIAVLH
ncbi:MAG: A24 family peptidase [Candidatus Parcubacteria bacterium]|nr:A24 family peptidase [Candidatus Parcubacteria bacterium]